MTNPVDYKPAFEDCFRRFPPDARILDVGCGIGELTAQMAQRVPAGSVLGVDLCYQSIVQASRRSPPTRYPNLRFTTANARSLKLKEEPFDFVVSRNCLHLVQVPGLAFPAMARNLKPGGTLYTWFQGWGHGQAILDCLFELFERDRWKAYFADFKLSRFLITPQFCQPWFHLCQLHLNQVQLVQETIELPSRPIFLQWLSFNWPEYWGLIPSDERDQFNQEFLELYPLKTAWNYQVQVVWLVIDALKE